MAQRVMDCGDAGHILLSKRVADDLEQYAQWRPYLHEFGECKEKHTVRIHAFNVYADELGTRLRPRNSKTVSELFQPDAPNFPWLACSRFVPSLTTPLPKRLWTLLLRWVRRMIKPFSKTKRRHTSPPR
jgi:hypothetical protein